MEPTFDPVVPLLSLYQKVSKSAYYSDAVTLMLTAPLFTIARLWNQSRCPSIDEWLKKLWYIYSMEYYSDLKKNKIMSFAGK